MGVWETNSATESDFPTVAGRRAPARPEAGRLIVPGDAARVAKLTTIAIASWLVPAPLWPSFSGSIATFELRMRQRDTMRRADLIARTLGGGDAMQPIDNVRQGLVVNNEALLQHFHRYRPRARLPGTHLAGRAHLDDALAKGNGVILWVGNFAFSDLVTKIALDQAGYAVSHLSRPSHGYSASRFGIRFLNRLKTTIENRHLKERVVIKDDETVAPLRDLRKRLEHNGVVSITAGDQARRVARPRFLRARLRLATGPVHLARLSGATLLPVFTIRDQGRSFTTHIGPPLTADDRAGKAFGAALAQQYAARLEPFVRGHPSLWQGWDQVDVA